VSCNLDDSDADPGPQPKLRRLHSDATIRQGNQSSYGYWSLKGTQEIVESLQPGGVEPLTVKQDGTVMQGNTRLLVLEERGFDINSLARVSYP
jgi:hypothetical protein